MEDQLEGGTLAVVFNTAEGVGRRSGRHRRRFFAMSRGTAVQAAGVIDVLRRRHLAPESACATARSLAVRVVQLLTKLDQALA